MVETNNWDTPEEALRKEKEGIVDREEEQPAATTGKYVPKVYKADPAKLEKRRKEK